MNTTEKAPTASDLMSKRVLAVRPDMPLIDALRVMVSAEMRHLPVLDDGLCRGMLTESDALAVLAERGPLMGLHSHGLLVEDACRRPAPTIPSTAGLADVARRLLEGGLDAVLVKDRGKVVGIITTTDLVRMVAS